MSAPTRAQVLADGLAPEPEPEPLVPWTVATRPGDQLTLGMAA